MNQNFVAVDREQAFLLPPDVRDWLPERHFAWFVIEAVAQMDLAAFYAVYRSAYPLDAGYAVRKQLYNLYHVLNHFNLFGGGYVSSVESALDSLR